jgi:hypothetical protein
LALIVLVQQDVLRLQVFVDHVEVVHVR